MSRAATLITSCEPRSSFSVLPTATLHVRATTAVSSAISSGQAQPRSPRRAGPCRGEDPRPRAPLEHSADSKSKRRRRGRCHVFHDALRDLAGPAVRAAPDALCPHRPVVARACGKHAPLGAAEPDRRVITPKAEMPGGAPLTTRAGVETGPRHFSPCRPPARTADMCTNTAAMSSLASTACELCIFRARNRRLPFDQERTFSWVTFTILKRLPSSIGQRSPSGHRR